MTGPETEQANTGDRSGMSQGSFWTLPEHPAWRHAQKTEEVAPSHCKSSSSLALEDKCRIPSFTGTSHGEGTEPQSQVREAGTAQQTGAGLGGATGDSCPRKGISGVRGFSQ